MHLILKCVVSYEIFYVDNVHYLTCVLDDVVICDSEITIEGNNAGFGINCRTSEYGLFLFKNFVIIDSTNNVNDSLTIIAKKYQANPDLVSRTNIPGIFHRSSKKSLAMASMCALCGEYMIGLKLEFFHCILCNQVFHGLCWKNHVSFKKCYRFFKIMNPAMISSFKSTEINVVDWSKEQIIQWLCSVNLFQMIDLFELKNINGKALMSLMPDNEETINNNDRNTLPLWSLIPDKFYREALYLALLDLLGRTKDLNNEFRRSSKNVNNSGHIASDSRSNHPNHILISGDHHLREVTYLCNTYCYYCSKILLGINKQGLHCVKCRVDFHKMCAAQIDITCCQGTVITDEIDLLDSSVFGIPLEDQVTDKDNVPIFLKSCLKRLEFRQNIINAGSKLLEWYSERSGVEDLVVLRKLFSHPLYDENGDLKNLSGLSNSLVAKLVKLFFKELPEPLFTYGLYHSLVEGVRLEHDDHVNCSNLHSFIVHLPSINKATLLLLTNHFEFICQRSMSEHDKVKRMAEKWSLILSNSLMWPPHIMLNEINNNKIKHMKIVQLLFEYKLMTFEKFMWLTASDCEYAECGDEPMYLSQSLSVKQLTKLQYDVSDANNSLHHQDWYWSDTTKDEVNDVMACLQDGSFLVRDSSNKTSGEYTLTVRKDGVNKLIRIMSSGGMYGFKPPYEFRSVVELISYYQTTKLSNYNDQLNLTLRFPVSKRKSEVYGRSNDCYDLDDDALINMFYNAMKEYGELNTNIDKNTLENETCQKELDELTRSIKGVDLIHSWVNKQTEHIMNTIHLNPSIKDHNTQSLITLNKRLNNCAEALKIYHKLREELTAKSTALMNSLCVDRPNVKKLSRRQQQCVRQLKERGVPAEMFDGETIDVDELCEQIRQNLNSSNPINDINTWFIADITRQESISLLTGKRHGTFLVRKSSKEANWYALDIVVNNVIQHCLIYCYDGMYGFVKNECLYSSLKDLVKTFHLRSLDQYNKDLTTKLTYPVKHLSITTV